MDKETGLYDVSMVKKKLIASTLDEVFKALKERGDNPVNQIVGYLISGDPGYISNYKDINGGTLANYRVVTKGVLDGSDEYSFFENGEILVNGDIAFDDLFLIN